MAVNPESVATSRRYPEAPVMLLQLAVKPVPVINVAAVATGTMPVYSVAPLSEVPLRKYPRPSTNTDPLLLAGLINVLPVLGKCDWP
jgi:hypothetical protein